MARPRPSAVWEYEGGVQTCINGFDMKKTIYCTNNDGRSFRRNLFYPLYVVTCF